MDEAVVLVRLAEYFNDTLEWLVRDYGRQGGERLFEDCLRDVFPRAYGRELGENYHGPYEEVFPFGNMPQDVIYARLYDLNNRDGCATLNGRTLGLARRASMQTASISHRAAC